MKMVVKLTIPMTIKVIENNYNNSGLPLLRRVFNFDDIKSVLQHFIQKMVNSEKFSKRPFREDLMFDVITDLNIVELGYETYWLPYGGLESHYTPYGIFGVTPSKTRIVNFDIPEKMLPFFTKTGFMKPWDKTITSSIDEKRLLLLKEAREEQENGKKLLGELVKLDISMLESTKAYNINTSDIPQNIYDFIGVGQTKSKSWRHNVVFILSPSFRVGSKASGKLVKKLFAPGVKEEIKKHFDESSKRYKERVDKLVNAFYREIREEPKVTIPREQLEKRQVTMSSLKVASEFFLRMKEPRGFFQVNENVVAYCSNYMNPSHVMMIITKKGRDDIFLTEHQMKIIKKKTVSKKENFLAFPTYKGDFYMNNVKISMDNRTISAGSKYDEFIKFIDVLKPNYTGAITIGCNNLENFIMLDNGEFSLQFDKNGLIINGKKVGDVSIKGSGKFRAQGQSKTILDISLNYLKGYCRNVIFIAGDMKVIAIKCVGIDIGTIFIAPSVEEE